MSTATGTETSYVVNARDLTELARDIRDHIRADPAVVGVGIEPGDVVGVHPGGPVVQGGACYLTSEMLACVLRARGFGAWVQGVTVDISDHRGARDSLELARSRIAHNSWPGITTRWPRHPYGFVGHCVVIVQDNTGVQWFVDPTVAQFRDHSPRDKRLWVTPPDIVVQALDAPWSTASELVGRGKHALMIYTGDYTGILPPYVTATREPAPAGRSSLWPSKYSR